MVNIPASLRVGLGGLLEIEGNCSNFL